MTKTPRKPRGMLGPLERPFEHRRMAPPQELAFFVEHFWYVGWDLPAQRPHRQETMPHPSIHLVVEKDRVEVVGVQKGRFTRMLEGQGKILGVKFRPGGFYPFYKQVVSGFTDGRLSLGEAFGSLAQREELESRVLAGEGPEEMCLAAAEFLRKRLPEADENTALVNRVIELIVKDQEIRRVDQLLELTEIKKRTLQKLFNLYVGVSPKWVIQRYRLFDALDFLEQGGQVSWSQLALELGYFDQSHFVNHFKAMVGLSPAEYMKKYHA